jgi:cholesterol transport system auxiliary component
MRPVLAVTILLLSWATFGSGCTVGLAPERPLQPVTHDFGPVIDRPREKTAGYGSQLAVEAPEWLQNNRIHYRLFYSDPTRVRSYALDRWLAPPPMLLAQRLSGGSGAAGGCRLRIQLKVFEQLFDRPESARVVMVFFARVQTPGTGRPVYEKAFQLSHSTISADAAGAVSGLALLVDDAGRRLRTWLAGLPPCIVPVNRGSE